MDDLLDLSWSSSSSSKPTPPPLQPRQNPSFEFLSKQPLQTSNYQIPLPIRTSTPSTAPLRQSGASTPQPVTALPTSPHDAFSSLFSLEAPRGPSVKLSLAERQAQMAADLKRKEEHERQQFEAHGAFWDTLGGGASPGRAKQDKDVVRGKGLEGFEDLLKPSKLATQPPTRINTPILVAPTPKPTNKSPMGSFWSLDTAQAGSSSSPYEAGDDGLMGVKPSTAQPVASTSKSYALSVSERRVDLFDFDDMESAVPSLAVGGGSGQGGSSGMRTPVSDFDFGEGIGPRSGRLDPTMMDDDGDDILGDLARPVQPKPVAGGEESDTRQRSRPSKPGRSNSPPPHIVGQIVEMGFSPIQARSALSKTSTGLDVAAALELLLGPSSAQGGTRSSNNEDEDPRGEMEPTTREEAERERRRRRRIGPSRDTIKPRTRDRTEEGDAGTSTPEFGEQADRILAQASEIGQSVLSKATSFWNTGKEKALKAYEEQQRRAVEASKGKAGEERKDGRPRWMTEALAEDAEEIHGGKGGFKDDDDEVLPQKPVGKANGVKVRASSQPKDETPPSEPEYRSTRERADLLFAEEPRSYKPANRHRKPTAQSSPAVSQPVTPVRPTTPLRTRQLVQASTAQIANSARYRAAGNEHYKLGRFTEANSSYSTALTALPEGHILLIPTYNNRATTRLKLGESIGAIDDCTNVIEAIGLSFNPDKETPLPAEFTEVKLGEGLVKAVVKRAQACEMAEKWKSAGEDWERVMGFDTILLGSAAAATRNLAVEGARRSRRMLEEQTVPKPTTTSEPIAKSHSRLPVAPAPTPADPEKSQAVTALRQANLATEVEDAQKLALKDSVDARLLAWKGGKETNLRALISSLNMVLWDEVLAGGLKVGMHELISEKQVKIKYMKVIARLHPDKLSVANTSVEQRMLANGAFGALNDAWQAFNSS